MDNWGKGIFANKILLRKINNNSYEPIPQKSPTKVLEDNELLELIFKFENHEKDPYP